MLTKYYKTHHLFNFICQFNNLQFQLDFTHSLDETTESGKLIDFINGQMERSWCPVPVVLWNRVALNWINCRRNQKIIKAITLPARARNLIGEEEARDRCWRARSLALNIQIKWIIEPRPTAIHWGWGTLFFIRTVSFDIFYDCYLNLMGLLNLLSITST